MAPMFQPSSARAGEGTWIAVAKARPAKPKHVASTSRQWKTTIATSL
jgi:hypothetical protein